MGGLDSFCRRNTPQKPQKWCFIIIHPPTLTVPPGPQPCLSSNDTELFCLQCAPAMSLWLADALVLQWKTKWAWKETMSLTLEDFMFSTSLSHQWIYEPGEEFPERKCHAMIPQNVTLGKGGKKKKVRMTSHQIWKHSPIFPSLIFYLVNFSQILYSLLHFSAYPEGIWILFWPWSAKIMHSHLEFHTNKSIPPTQGWNKQFFWYTKLEEIYHLKEGVHNNSAVIIAEIKIFWLESNWQL